MREVAPTARPETTREKLSVGVLEMQGWRTSARVDPLEVFGGCLEGAAEHKEDHAVHERGAPAEVI
jgi:hypothetical protein